ncbi:hypothetical protein E4U59_004629 [Claviceps monticola]|nr:hypothetical protein E4U59_004629 [Claviceps monticola]
MSSFQSGERRIRDRHCRLKSKLEPGVRRIRAGFCRLVSSLMDVVYAQDTAVGSPGQGTNDTLKEADFRIRNQAKISHV